MFESHGYILEFDYVLNVSMDIYLLINLRMRTDPPSLSERQFVLDGIKEGVVGNTVYLHWVFTLSMYFLS